MAGLQFYFFPTDFYYPRPPKAVNDTTSAGPPSNKLVAVPNQTQPNQPLLQKDDADHKLVHVYPNKVELLKLLSTTSRPSIPKTGFHVDKTNPFA